MRIITCLASFFFAIILENSHFVAASAVEDDLPTKSSLVPLAISSSIFSVSIFNLNEWKPEEPDKIKRDTHTLVVIEGRNAEKVSSLFQTLAKNTDFVFFLAYTAGRKVDDLHFSSEPNFVPDEDGNWMLGVHFLPASGSELRFLNTQSVKKRILSEYFEIPKSEGTFCSKRECMYHGKYQLVASWQVAARDALHGLSQVYILQSQLSYSQPMSILGSFIGDDDHHKTLIFHCAIFAELFLRSCGIGGFTPISDTRVTPSFSFSGPSRIRTSDIGGKLYYQPICEDSQRRKVVKQFFLSLGNAQKILGLLAPGEEERVVLKFSRELDDSKLSYIAATIAWKEILAISEEEVVDESTKKSSCTVM